MFSKERSGHEGLIGIPVDKKRKEVLIALQRGLRIRFSDISLLNLALAHRSYTNENKLLLNNERLEFLGDSVLGLVIADQLYRVRGEEKEGYLAKCKAHLVSEKILNQVAQTLTIDAALLIGRGEELSGGREKSAILADTLEAIIGAYYLDSGFKQASGLVLRIFQSEITAVLKGEHSPDYKTLLQEYVQHHFKSYPVYKVTRRSGPEHKQIFWTTAEVRGKSYGPASGLNKKEAEQAVAEVTYRYLVSTDQSDERSHANQRSKVQSKQRAKPQQHSSPSRSVHADTSQQKQQRKSPLSSRRRSAATMDKATTTQNRSATTRPKQDNSRSRGAVTDGGEGGGKAATEGGRRKAANGRGDAGGRWKAVGGRKAAGGDKAATEGGVSKVRRGKVVGDSRAADGRGNAGGRWKKAAKRQPKATQSS